MNSFEKQRHTLSTNDKKTLEHAVKELLQSSSKETLLENLTIYEQKNKTAAR